MIRRASVLVLALVSMLAIVLLVTIGLSLSQATTSTSKTRVSTQAALQVAESGIEKATWCLNNPASCPGGAGFTGESDVTVGNGKYTTSVSIAGNTATITSTSTVAGPSGPITKQIQATATIAASLTPAFQFGVQSGIGGITMSNNAHIDGNIYTSGSVSGSNGSYITGDAILTPSDGVLDSIANPVVSPSPTTLDFGTTTGTKYLAQSFVPTVSDYVYAIDYKFARVLSPTSTVKVQIYSDNAGKPGSDLTGGGQTLPTTSIPNSTDPTWWGTNTGNGTGWSNQIYNPPTKPILNSGNTYWLVFTTSATNTSKFWRTVKGVDTTYATGTAKIGSSLTTLTPACGSACDLAFRLTMGGVEPTLSLPSVQGNAFAYTISGTTVGKKAYYNNVVGTVTAGGQPCYNTSNTGNCFSGQPDKDTSSFPISDSQISTLEGQATLGGTKSTNCTINGGSIGPMEYDCDVTLNGTVTLTGTVWVNGNLTITNGAILQLAPGYATSSGVIVADKINDRSNGGIITLSNNGNLTGNGTAGTYIMAISTHDDPTSSNAISVSNNLTAGVLYAPYGIVSIYNNAALKEVTALKLVLSNNASVQYESGIASAIFTSGPGGSWTYQKGSYQVTE